MKRSPFVAACLALCALAFIPATQADDLKEMQGRWTVEKVEVGGKEVDGEGLKKLAVTITGDRYELMTDDGPDAGTLKLDETTKPKTMDATDTEGSDVGKVTKAIYEITGDTLRVCLAGEDGGRPTELATKEGVSWLLITYKREK